MKKLFGIPGILFSAYGVLVILSTESSHWFTYSFLGLGIALLVLSRFTENLKRMNKGLKTAICVILIAALAVFGVFEAKIISFSRSDAAPGADYIMVLGAKVNGASPSLEFAVRIDAAAEYLKNNPSAKAITTGGKGGDEGIAEGVCARERLIARGIDEDRILTEDKSASTLENFAFSRALIEADGGSPEESSIAVVSSRFHLYRASRYAKSQGYLNTSYQGCSGLFLLVPFYYTREFAAYTKDLLSGKF